MTSKKLSVRNICLFVSIGILITSIVFLIMAYLITGNIILIFGGIIFLSCIYIWIGLLIFLVRKKLILFTSCIAQNLKNITNGDNNFEFNSEEDTLLSRINYRISRLFEIMQESNCSVANEKADLEELISDISHQVKTPIANLKMINSTFLERKLPEKTQIEFLQAMNGQLDKLDFLMQAMIKTSRLETGIITLEKKNCYLYETLASVMGNTLFMAENKNIEIVVDCTTNLMVSHDRKWTTEALFNILDNAIKYSPKGGKIHVTVTVWEMYTKIDISDNGKGISEKHQAEIFKRFYREDEVHDIPGIGIGLYLAREIITMQGGYIKVVSNYGQGSTFSVFLPNR
ncbi:HAMP domain-containing histidine kinase [Clostridium estertheticum]|uniref:sensor histidine kinase n=1 Tax=Clostridium estertheticum TaxID=238834 RepID=UPI0013EE9503|nr:HAMP domain-containing sensor histidine kinase [Clostridium estertheticum]MBZ9609559.1 HAMP domain-containing histidine kinase [Clostridium estertheticum]